ncbi:hypothetical protein EYF80_025718 [Liparis tanakae]|uniref:Uncharacterized protein n=1 Tax=Liparis tanakae TaxID=230148 RepID=A0A4Z2HEW6_9TELE|nr:hypothetical protein EYF80_025718 [Liparis tanakae]
MLLEPDTLYMSRPRLCQTIPKHNLFQTNCSYHTHSVTDEARLASAAEKRSRGAPAAHRSGFLARRGDAAAPAVPTHTSVLRRPLLDEIIVKKKDPSGFHLRSQSTHCSRDWPETSGASVWFVPSGLL